MYDQMKPTARGLITAGTKNSERRTFRVFSTRFSDRASPSPITFVRNTKEPASFSVFQSAPRRSGVFHISVKFAKPIHLGVLSPFQFVNAYTEPDSGGTMRIAITKINPG